MGQCQPRRRYYFPFHPALCQATSKQHNRKNPGVECMTTSQAPSTIYIVDDDEAVRDSLRWLLEANGYRVRSYSGAEEFLHAYEPDQVGVLIADVRIDRKSTRLNSSH